MKLSFENAADEVLLALTHGPTPSVSRNSGPTSARSERSAPGYSARGSAG